MTDLSDATRDHYKHRLARFRRPVYSYAELAPWLYALLFLVGLLCLFQ